MKKKKPEQKGVLLVHPASQIPHWWPVVKGTLNLTPRYATLDAEGGWIAGVVKTMLLTKKERATAKREWERDHEGDWSFVELFQDSSVGNA